MKETLESSKAKDDAISAALEGIPEIGADWTPPGQAELKSAENQDDDDHSESASTETPSQAKAEDKPPVKRPAAGSQDQKPVEEAAKFEAPKNWAEGRRKAFASAPVDLQKEWLAMHNEANAGFTKYAQEMSQIRKSHETFQQEIAPWAGEIQQAGMTPGQAFAFMAQERQKFNQQPEQFLVPVIQRLGPDRGAALIKAVIEGAGIRPEQIFGSQPQQPQQEDLWVDPSVLQLRQRFEQELTPLQQKLQQLEHANLLRQQQEQQARQQWEHHQRQQHETQLQTIENDLVNTLGSVDEAGNPKYPDFDDIQDELIELLETPRFKAMPVSPEKFDKAYRQVMRGRDDYFDKQVEAAAAKRAADAQQQKAVQKAAAAATRKPGPGSQGNVRPGPMSSDAAIAKAFEELGI